jgi:sugar transferase EpsL
MKSNEFFSALVKRAFDLTVSLLCLIVLAPVMLVVAVAIRRSMGSPVIFKQQRPGLRGKPFYIYKFRTMRDASGASGPLPDAERLTCLGLFLRNASLDELPELFNVIRGNMSLVGPRPLKMEYLPLYTPEQARRHDVKPGVTGWAQINGRNAISWESKFALDLWYVEHRGFWLDFWIILRTAATVFRRQGVNAPSHATMPPFTGTKTRSESTE